MSETDDTEPNIINLRASVQQPSPGPLGIPPKVWLAAIAIVALLVGALVTNDGALLQQIPGMVGAQ